jgi:putative transposase
MPHHLGLQIHVVFIPKCRRKTLYRELRRYLGEVFHKLAAQNESKIEEGHLMPDHVHMMLSIPPKYAVSQVVRFMQNANAISWASIDEEAIRAYVRGQEKEDQRLKQLNLWALSPPPSVGSKLWGRVSAPSAASSGFNHKAPGSAGGYLHGRRRRKLCASAKSSREPSLPRARSALHPVS